MTTAAENELITRVGPGTPGGELLRRYWHPVAMVRELFPESPTRHVRILGELWEARSSTELPPGAHVRVVAVDGLTLEVEPVDEAAAPPS